MGTPFGPNKVELDQWDATPVWANPAECRLSMKALPFQGSTFPDVSVSEAGRRLAVQQFRALPPRDVAALFAAARFRESAQSGRGADPQAWANVFLKKVKEIEEAGPCGIG